MAAIYGFPPALKNLLEISPDSIKRFEEIDRISDELMDRLKDEKRRFDKNVPHEIEKEKNIIKKLNKEQKDEVKKLNQEIEELRHSKIKRPIYKAISDYFRSVKIKHKAIPKKIKEFDELEVDQKHRLMIWNNHPDDVFNEEQEELLEEISIYDDIMKTPFYSESKGELMVLKELAKLNSDHSIFCGVEAEIPNRIKSGDKRYDLNSAIMDFVVISYKGIFLIEVNNWGNDLFAEHTDFNPHKHLESASKVFFHNLMNDLPDDVAIMRRVNTILVPIQKNLHYDRNFESVNVLNVKKLNDFIKKGRDVMSDYDLDCIKELLSGSVTDVDECAKNFYPYTRKR